MVNSIKGAQEAVEYSRGEAPPPEAAKAREAKPVPQTHAHAGVTEAEKVAAKAEPLNAQITFAIDAQLREAIIKIVDPKTKEVIREIPSKEAQRVSRAYLQAQHEHAAKAAE